MDITYKPGDKVAIDKGGSYQGYQVGTVERITPSGQIVVNLGGMSSARFDKDGREVGSRGTWRWRIVPLTAEIQDKIDTQRIASKLGILNWSKVSVDKLRAIESILDTK